MVEVTITHEDRGDSGRYVLTVKGYEMLEEQSESGPVSQLRMLNSPKLES